MCTYPAIASSELERDSTSWENDGRCSGSPDQHWCMKEYLNMMKHHDIVFKNIFKHAVLKAEYCVYSNYSKTQDIVSVGNIHILGHFTRCHNVVPSDDLYQKIVQKIKNKHSTWESQNSKQKGGTSYWMVRNSIIRGQINYIGIAPRGSGGSWSLHFSWPVTPTFSLCHTRSWACPSIWTLWLETELLSSLPQSSSLILLAKFSVVHKLVFH